MGWGCRGQEVGVGRFWAGREIVEWRVPRTEAPWRGDAGARRGASVGFWREIVGWEVPRTEAQWP
eukprot:7735745-Pyramimonas_sp.AAC.1